MTFPLSAYLPYTNKEGKTTAGCIPYDSSLEQEIKDIISGKHKEIVNRLRAIEDKHQRAVFKAANLPCFTASVICKEWRKSANIVQHTGLLCFDIDQHDNPDIDNWGELRDAIFKQPEVAACFVSASGKGLAFIMHIIPGHHIDTFRTVQYKLKEKGIVVDNKCIDLVRLRFSSFDPEAKFRDYPDILLPDFDMISNKYESNTRYKVTGPVNSRANYRHGMKEAESKFPFCVGSRHYHLLQVGSYCNHIGMPLQDCENHTLHFYQRNPISPKQIADLSNDALLEPIRSSYRTYKEQFGTYKAKKPKYTFKILKRLLSLVDKHLLRKYIDQYGEDTYIGNSGRTFTVSNIATAFFMYLLEPSVTWTTNEGYELFTNEEIKELIPKDAYLDSCNGSRVWCCKKNKIPLSWL
jgi:hypothetical protein